jgi:hypothetical protein
MRYFASFFGAATVCTLVSLASAQQQLPKFNVGDAVDVNSFGKWVPCTVSSPLSFGAYKVHCDNLDLSAKADPQEIRVHIIPATIPTVTETKEVAARAPQGESIGARYGTREPRTCQPRKGEINATDAKDLFICDAEHEFGGNLYLVSDVNLLVSNPRPFNPNDDASKVGIDASQPVYDIRASFNHYQCSQIPSAFVDYPGTRNCNEDKMSNAAGGCYKTQAGEWRCTMYDFRSGAAAASASLTNVKPPTLVD